VYRGFKIVTVLIATLAILTDVLLLLVALPEAIDNQTLSGGGRAQSEFFTMPLLFVGGGFSLLCLGLLISNLVTDIVRLIKKSEFYHRNILTYSLLVIAIIIPYIATTGLIDLMYSGWK
jgi:hypothetical protein